MWMNDIPSHPLVTAISSNWLWIWLLSFCLSFSVFFFLFLLVLRQVLDRYGFALPLTGGFIALEVVGCVSVVGLISSQQKFQVVVVRNRPAITRFRHE